MVGEVGVEGRTERRGRVGRKRQKLCVGLSYEAEGDHQQRNDRNMITIWRKQEIGE